MSLNFGERLIYEPLMYGTSSPLMDSVWKVLYPSLLQAQKQGFYSMRILWGPSEEFSEHEINVLENDRGIFWIARVDLAPQLKEKESEILHAMRQTARDAREQFQIELIECLFRTNTELVQG